MRAGIKTKGSEVTVSIAPDPSRTQKVTFTFIPGGVRGRGDRDLIVPEHAQEVMNWLYARREAVGAQQAATELWQKAVAAPSMRSLIVTLTGH